MTPDPHRSANRPRSLRQPTAPSSDPAHYDFIRRGSNVWTTGHISLQELCVRQELGSEILAVFLPAVADLTSANIHKELSDQFNIPAAFWSSVVQDASGFFGCEDTRDNNGGLETFNSYFRFLIKEPANQVPFLTHADNVKNFYTWHKLGFYTTWTPLKSLVIFCFGLALRLKHLLSNLEQVQLEDPFSFHTIVTENVIGLYDSSLWSWRNLIRKIEENRTSPVDPKPDYTTMHELARHTIHSSETLAIAVETMASLVQEHEIFFEENSSLPTRSITVSKQTRRVFRSQIVLFKCLHLRSKALEERLRNEINLVVSDTDAKEDHTDDAQAFNTVAQHDSRITVDIGKATQTDGAAMKTISVLGLAFLPGTFICALFSTSFFSFSPGNGTEPQHWTVSEKFWVYWVVAVPVTVVTVICWISWQRAYRMWPAAVG